MATIAELQAELAEVKTAISAAYGNAEYDIESGNSRRRMKRQSLTVLLSRRSQLELSISRLEGAGGRGVMHAVPER
jgi:hypothetical protein